MIKVFSGVGVAKVLFIKFSVRKIFYCKNICCILWIAFIFVTSRWRHNGHDGIWNHQPHACLVNGLFRRRSKKTSKLRINGLCEGNSPETGEFSAQMASYAENVSIWWRHHEASWGVRHCRCSDTSQIWNQSKGCIRKDLCQIWILY